MRHKSQIMGSIVVLLIFSLALPAQAGPPIQAPPPQPDKALIAQLEKETGGAVRLSYHSETGKVRYIGVPLDRPIGQPTLLAAGASPETAARGFLAVYGRLFGLRDPTRELEVMRVRPADRGRSFVRFQQVYEGIPVLGGELIVQVNAANNILSANGEILPDLALDVTPGVAPESARLTALEAVAKGYGLAADDLMASEPQLWIYNPLLLGGPGARISRLVWRMEVTSAELLHIRELVLVDAQRGSVALHFNQIDAAKNRQIYDNQNNPSYGLPGNGPVRTEGSPATYITDVDNAYDYAGFTYDFYSTYHGRDSIDDAGMTLINTVRYCPNTTSCPYENAFWDGDQMVYGAGYASADDVVAHEMTHGVTQYESNLFYYMQSGAINEALSDIWGELVDLTYSNGQDNDSSSVRWLMGENLPIGAIRSMSNPPAYQDPDKMTSAYYYCGTEDNGGVHTNSGVANKAAYLMVDGGTFNGYTVTPLGITKTAKIWYEAQTGFLLSGSDYQDLYDALYQACLNLVGTGGITYSDCQEVRDATEATEMDVPPPSCAATDAPLCYFGDPLSTLFYDDFESGPDNWTSGANQGSDEWYYENAYATSGIYHLYGYDQPDIADYYVAMASNVSLPAGQEVYLHFSHAYDFEASYDGGVVEYSADGGPWTDAGPLFTHNGYNGTISTAYGNPLGGRSGFVNHSYGYISSRLHLTSLAGKSVRFRYRIGTDSSGDDLGWFIDDVRIYTCASGGHSVYLPLVLRNYPKLLLNGNFEKGRDGSWSEYSSHGWPLIVNENNAPVDAHGGSWLAWLGGDNNETSILSQDMTIPSNATTLNYWYWAASQDACGYDYGYVRFGSATLRTYNLCSSNNTGGWVYQQINIAAYRGQTVNLRFVVTTDSSLNSNFFLDDVSISTGTTLAVAPPSDLPASFRADPAVEKSEILR